MQDQEKYQMKGKMTIREYFQAVKADFKACPQWHGKGMVFSLVYDFFYPNYRYRFLFWLRTCEVSMSYGKWGG